MSAGDSSSNKRVVIIDDDPLVRDLTAHTIEFGANRRVIAFESGLKAWGYLQQRPEKVDVVIADANLPDMDGFELLVQLKLKFSEKVFVITTSNPQNVHAAGRLGADAVLLKPFDIHDLFMVLARFIVRDECAASQSTPKMLPHGLLQSPAQ